MFKLNSNNPVIANIMNKYSHLLDLQKSTEAKIGIAKKDNDKVKDHLDKNSGVVSIKANNKLDEFYKNKFASAPFIITDTSVDEDGERKLTDEFRKKYIRNYLIYKSLHGLVKNNTPYINIVYYNFNLMATKNPDYVLKKEYKNLISKLKGWYKEAGSEKIKDNENPTYNKNEQTKIINYLTECVDDKNSIVTQMRDGKRVNGLSSKEKDLYDKTYILFPKVKVNLAELIRPLTQLKSDDDDFLIMTKNDISDNRGLRSDYSGNRNKWISKWHRRYSDTLTNSTQEINNEWGYYVIKDGFYEKAIAMADLFNDIYDKFDSEYKMPLNDNTSEVVEHRASTNMLADPIAYITDRYSSRLLYQAIKVHNANVRKQKNIKLNRENFKTIDQARDELYKKLNKGNTIKGHHAKNDFSGINGPRAKSVNNVGAISDEDLSFLDEE